MILLVTPLVNLPDQIAAITPAQRSVARETEVGTNAGSLRCRLPV